MAGVNSIALGFIPQEGGANSRAVGSKEKDFVVPATVFPMLLGTNSIAEADIENEVDGDENDIAEVAEVDSATGAIQGEKCFS